MNSDIVRLQNAFASIDADLVKAEASVPVIKAKLEAGIDPTVVASLATQAEGFNVRTTAVAVSLTDLATGTSTATATDTGGGA